MPAFYLDTSGLIKRYLTEQGSEVIDSLVQPPTRNDVAITSFLAVLEVNASITRLAKGGQLRQRVADRILTKFREDTDRALLILPLNNAIGQLAVSVVLDYKLRSADALHLATAFNYRSYYPEASVVFVTSDRELLEAASLSGLAVLNPGDSNASRQLANLRSGGS